MRALYFARFNLYVYGIVCLPLFSPLFWLATVGHSRKQRRFDGDGSEIGGRLEVGMR